MLGGPLGEGGQVLLIVNAASEEEIRARLAAYLWTRMGLLQIAKIERWELLLGQTELNTGRAGER